MQDHDKYYQRIEFSGIGNSLPVCEFENRLVDKMFLDEIESIFNGRMLEVFRFLRKGKTHNEIAIYLKISRKTVHEYFRRIQKTCKTNPRFGTLNSRDD